MGLAPSRKILNIFKVWTSKSSAAPMCIPALEHRAQPAVLRRRGFGSFDEPKGSTVRPGSRGDPFLDADHGVKGLDRYAAAKPPLTPWSASKSCRPRDPGRTIDPPQQLRNDYRSLVGQPSPATALTSPPSRRTPRLLPPP